MTIFGVPWNELTLKDVQRFLANAGREPLTWEAKGKQLRPEHVTKNVAGFANAEDGGYLLLGVELVDDEWQTTGLEFPDDDPPAWISRIVRTTMNPRPRIDVADWPVLDKKRLAVVRVDPVAEPPCVTNDGQLFERVSGETVTVRNPADVRALYEKGSSAVDRAQVSAERALDAVASRSVPPNLGGSFLLVGLVVAPVGTARDIAAAVFSPGAVAQLRALADALPKEPHFPERGLQTERVTDVVISQGAVVFETSPDLVQMWRIRSAWDGSVAGLFRASPGSDFKQQYVVSDTLFDEIVQPLATTVEAAARLIGGYGRAHVAFRPIADDFGIRHGQPFAATHSIPGVAEILPIKRWAVGDVWFDANLLQSMKRELLRSCGFLELEPNPPPPARSTDDSS